MHHIRSKDWNIINYWVSTQDPPNYGGELELENEYLNSGVHVDLKGNDDYTTQIFERETRNGKCTLNYLIDKKERL